MTDVADGELNLEKGLPGNTLAGTVFDSKYEVLGEIARGGMGIVYRGTDQSLGRSVAIKVLLRQFNSDSESVARFRREARAMAALDHPNVVPVYAIGHELELHYFVMKFLAGWTVSERLKRVRLGLAEPFSQEECRACLIQLCRGLEHAHRRSLIHRDIKPSNIMIGPDGHTTIMDFGIVKEAADDSLTKTGIVFGTPDYMAPEHAQGKPPSPATDLYSLGIVAYEMLTGQQPFKGSTPFSMVLKHIKEPPPPMIERCPDLNPAFQDIIFRAIEKKPEDRFASAAEMLEALQSLRLDQPEGVVHEDDGSQPFTDLDPTPEVPPVSASPQVVARPSLPRNRPSIFTGAPKSVVSPDVGHPESGLRSSPPSETPHDEPKRTAMVTDRPGHYQHLITSMESTQSARRRKSFTRTVVFVGLGIVVALAAVMIVQSMN